MPPNKSAEVQLKFFGKDEILRIIDTRKSIVKYLGRESTLCPLIGSEIKLVEIGKGKGGMVFSITFPGMGDKKYVVKRLEGVNFLRCQTTTKSTYGKTNGKGTITVPSKSYVCDEERYSEYVLSVLVGELYRKGECINFIDTFDFATCLKPVSNQYIFMERIDNVLKTIADCVFTEDYSIGMRAVIQLLFAIAIYQRKYKIVHGDLHLDNVFVEYVTPTTEFGGQKLAECDYFYYQIGKKTIYLPYTPFIIKIGDWGLSCKYSEPMVMNSNTMRDGYDQYEGFGPWIPNFYTETYDAVLSIGRCMLFAQDNSEMQTLFAEMMGKPDGEHVFYDYHTTQLNPESMRQKSEYWNDKDILTPYDMLTKGKSLAKYRKKPAGKGARIGTL